MKGKIYNLLIALTVLLLPFSAFGQKGDVFKSEAIMHEDLGNFEKAAVTYEKAIEGYNEINITDTLSIFKAGQNYARVNLNDKALPFLLKCEELNYQEPNLYITLSKVYTDTKQLKKAEAALLKGKELFPVQKEDFLRRIGLFYYNTHDFEKATSVFGTLLELTPNDLGSLYIQGSAQMYLNQFDDAAQSLEKILTLDPSHDKATKLLGLVYFKKADYLFQKETKRYEGLSKPTRMDYSNSLKKLDQITQGYALSLPHLEKALVSSPNDQTLVNCLKVAYKRLKMDEKAAELEK